MVDGWLVDARQKTRGGSGTDPPFPSVLIEVQCTLYDSEDIKIFRKQNERKYSSDDQRL